MDQIWEYPALPAVDIFNLICKGSTVMLPPATVAAAACLLFVLVDTGGFANFATFSNFSPPVPSTLPPVLKPPGKVFTNALLLCDMSCLQCFDAVGWAVGRASGL